VSRLMKACLPELPSSQQKVSKNGFSTFKSSTRILFT
jgi:hypothetical protein